MFNNQTKINDERIAKLENVNIQQELLIFGRPIGSDQSTITDKSHDQSLIDLICSHINKDLNISLNHKDINFLYKIKSKSGYKAPVPVLVNFVSMIKRNEVLQVARFSRKQRLKSGSTDSIIYYNERLTKINSEIFYHARSLLRSKLIASAWTFKGEIYIRKTSSSNPAKILCLKDLE